MLISFYDFVYVEAQLLAKTIYICWKISFSLKNETYGGNFHIVNGNQ